MSLRATVIETVGGHSGMDYYDYGLCSGLQQAQVDVTLYTCNETGILQTAPFTVKPYYDNIYGADPAWQRALRYLKGSWQSLRHAKQHRSQVCHLHFFHVGPLELFNVLLCKALGFRLIVTAHDVNSLADGLSVALFSHWSYRLADRVVVHNLVSKRELLASLPVTSEKVVVIPHGNYLNEIEELPESSTARKALGLPLNAKVLLFFGQIKAAKGLDILLAAMPDIIAAEPKVKLVVAGRLWKETFQKYQQIIDLHHIEEYCHLHIDHIPHDRVSSYFAAANLVILPYHKIYQSGVLLMSMSYGKPVLTSDLPGMTEVISDNDTGYLFSTRDVKDLATNVIRIFNNLKEADIVAKNGLNLMTDTYGWERIGQRTRFLYQTVLDKKNEKV